MSTPSTPDEKLPKLLLGQLPPDEAERLSATFSDDSRVVPVAESLGDDTLLASVKEAGTQADVSDPTADRLVDRLKADMEGVTRTSDGNEGGRAADEMPATLEYFKIERKLGQGGMGTVYLAQDTRLNRAVAVKTLKTDLARRPAAKDRFLREARVAAALEHESVVPIYYVGEDDGTPFLAMPLLKGRALDDHLKANGGKLPVADVLRIAAQVAGGLTAAHAVGLIHRDVKPSNLWVDADGRRVRVLDFGLARYETDESNLTASGIIVGTPAYMAPEQARGRAVDGRADLFSLGVVLYQMLTGQRPFTGPDTVAILSSLALDTPTAPRAINPDVPSELSDLVMRLLEKEPQNRPASAEVVRAAVERMAVSPTDDRTDLGSTPSDKAVTAKPTSESTPSVRLKSPRVPLAVALGLLAVFFGVAVVVYQLTFNTKDGTLVVEVDDEADVRFKNGRLEVYDDKGVLKYTLTPSERDTALPPGKYTVKVVGADGVKLDTEAFEIEKNGKRSVRVTATGPDGAVAHDPKRPVPVIPPSDKPVPPLALKAATWKPGPAENLLPGLVPRPAVLDGVGRWQVVQTPPAFLQPVPVGWSPDGARVAVVVSGSVRIYDSRTGSLLSLSRWVGDLLPHGGDSWHINWSPDSRWVRCAVRNKFGYTGVLVGVDGTPAPFSRWENAPADFVWNPKFPVFACVLPDKPDQVQLIDPSLTKPTEVEVRGVRQAAWSPDGEWLVAVRADNTAQLFGRDGKPGAKLDGTVSPSVAPVWAADGRAIAALASAGEVGLWKADGTAAAKTGTHKNGVASLHWQPDGKQLAVLDAAGTVHFWTATGAAAAGTADATADLASFQWAKGGQGFFTHGKFWPAVGNPTFIPLHTPGKEGSYVSPDDKRVARVKLGEITLHELDAAELKASSAKIPTWGEVTWDASGRRLAVTCQSGVAVYDATDPTKVVWLGGGAGVNVLTRFAFSPKGDRMAVASDLGRVLVCEPTGKVMRVIPTPAATPETGGFVPHAIHDLHWHPDGRHLAVTTGAAAVTVFDTVTGVAVATTGLPAARAGGSAQFSPTEPNRILISHPESSAVWQWKVEGEPQQKFAGLGRLTVSPDAKRYLAHQYDEQSAVLVSTDLKDRDSSGTKGYAATKFHPGPSLAWHPDGKHLVVTRLDETRNIQIRSLDGKVVEEIKPDGIDVTWLEWASPTPRGSVLVGRVGIDACVLDLNAKTFTPIAKVPGEVTVSPGGEHLIGVDGATLTYWHVGTKAVAQKVVFLPDGEFVTLSPAGEVLEQSANADRFYRYIVEDKSGKLILKTPGEMTPSLPK